MRTKNAKLIGTIIGIIAFVILIAGATYAWFTWRSSSINISGTSGCFVIDYGISKEIGATSVAPLKLGTSYSDGLIAEVTAKINSSCTGVTGKGTLYLNTNIEGTSPAILKGALKYHVIASTTKENDVVENPTVKNSQAKSSTSDKLTGGGLGSSEIGGTEIGGVEIGGGDIGDATQEQFKTGVITSTGKLAILTNIDLDTLTTRRYTVYVWIDGEIADNTYADATYSGYISLEATQNG